MHLAYYLGLTGNPLYEGDFEFGGKIGTYGQLGYAFDYVNCSNRAGFTTDFLTDCPDVIPGGCIQGQGRPKQLQNLPEYEWVLFDSICEADLRFVGERAKLITIVHNAGYRFSERIVDRSTYFLCMSEFSMQRQSAYICSKKLVLVPQRIDLGRFETAIASNGRIPRRILIFGRMHPFRFPVLSAVAERALQLGAEVWILGDGPEFWTITEKFSRRAIVVRFIPSASMPRFLHNFDLAITSGRGVMEALASGIPCVCAAFDYGGAVTTETIPKLWKTNFTGHQVGRAIENFQMDVSKACSVSPLILREWAETHFDATLSAREVARLIDASRITTFD